ncbi:hypothetical protein QTH90_14585 [Variovorax sp. J2P1-59]|uniref:hypothetical protein n=1 Tax=Variovorax flavidus TaxID=3053501 RepID=UPI0025771F4F|nr:hypothetical protein [Variovorax sp. J2P1-59]MDM0075627.1 hypothetical protein [Variovorax sp. J2P1-59]
MTPTRHGDASYRILMREGCRLVYGHMPLPEFLDLMRQAHDSEVLHPGLARMLDATAVIGRPEALARIRRQETPAAVERMRAQLGRAALRLDSHSLRWLAAGEQGPSSLALFVLLTGVRPRYYRGTTMRDLPREANAFRRCRLLIEQVPALRRALPVLAQRVAEPGIAEWAAIAEAWDDLCVQMDHEAPDWRHGQIKARGVTAMLKCFRELETA